MGAMKDQPRDGRRARRVGAVCLALVLVLLVVAACGRISEEADGRPAGDQPTTTTADGGLARSSDGAGSGGPATTTSAVATSIAENGAAASAGTTTTNAAVVDVHTPLRQATNDEEHDMTENPGGTPDVPQTNAGSSTSPGVVEGAPGNGPAAGSFDPSGPPLPAISEIPSSVAPPPVRPLPAQADPTQLRGRTWYVYAVTGPDGERVAPPWPVWLVFGQGQALQAHLGCNSGSGRWIVDGASIRVDQLMSTLMACFEVGDFQPFRASEDAAYQVHSNGTVTVLVADDGISSVELTVDSD